MSPSTLVSLSIVARNDIKIPLRPKNHHSPVLGRAGSGPEMCTNKNTVTITMSAAGVGILMHANIEQIWMGSFVFEGQGQIWILWNDLTIQQHDSSCVSGGQQRLTPRVGAHNLVRVRAAERLRLPRLQDTCMHHLRFNQLFIARGGDLWLNPFNSNEQWWTVVSFNANACHAQDCRFYLFSTQASGNKAGWGVSSHNGLELQRLLKLKGGKAIRENAATILP